MNADCIRLTVPAKPEYILVTRLTASSVATRAGFDIDAIEDIKSAVAEAAILVMNQVENIEEIILHFYLNENDLSIDVQAKRAENCKNLTKTSDGEYRKMSMFILEAMMDNVELFTEDGILSRVIMQKKYRGR